MVRFKSFKDKSEQCFYCRRLVSDLRASGIRITVDHVLPKSLGGGNESANLVTACEPCNNNKSDSTEWFEGCVAEEAFGNPEWFRDLLLHDEEIKGKRRKNGVKRELDPGEGRGKWRYNGWQRSSGPNNQEF